MIGWGHAGQCIWGALAEKVLCPSSSWISACKTSTILRALVSEYSEVILTISSFCHKPLPWFPLVDAGAARCMSGFPSSALQSLPPASANCPLEEWWPLGAYDPNGRCWPAEAECSSLSVQSTPLHPKQDFAQSKADHSHWHLPFLPLEGVCFS